jgi:hypothetical protein
MTKAQALQLLQKPLSEMTVAEKRQLAEAMRLVSEINRPVS